MLDDVPSDLTALGVATLHEALGRRGLVRGPRLMSGPAFAGRAETVAIPAGDNLGVHAALETAQPGSVLCIASGAEGTYGIVGELIVAAAGMKGIVGIVVDDGIRDVASLVAPPSVAARGISALGTVKRRAGSVGEPVAIGGVLVRPGDWVVGDRDGVLIIPASGLERLLVAAAARKATEASIRAAIQSGMTTVEALGLANLIQKGPRRA